VTPCKFYSIYKHILFISTCPPTLVLGTHVVHETNFLHLEIHVSPSLFFSLTIKLRQFLLSLTHSNCFFFFFFLFSFFFFFFFFFFFSFFFSSEAVSPGKTTLVLSPLVIGTSVFIYIFSMLASKNKGICLLVLPYLPLFFSYLSYVYLY
jgi:hypothetical protein